MASLTHWKEESNRNIFNMLKVKARFSKYLRVAYWKTSNVKDIVVILNTINWEISNNFNLENMYSMISNLESIIHFLNHFGLLSTAKHCPICNRVMFFIKKGNLNNYMSRCSSPCSKSMSVRTGTFLEKNKFNTQKLKKNKLTKTKIELMVHTKRNAITASSMLENGKKIRERLIYGCTFVRALKREIIEKYGKQHYLLKADRVKSTFSNSESGKVRKKKAICTISKINHRTRHDCISQRKYSLGFKGGVTHTKKTPEIIECLLKWIAEGCRITLRECVDKSYHSFQITV
ncbi:hypothetical protein A3Q56_05181 [Intoshia linei]|uniref:Uncharacterized protein n=1 Tax=Intoshia linei TaxID=1819745 RepID=A0A177B0D4_9BILA|nr:hypothetical protein A3Q56_05181 [Intoshia linei]